MSDSRVTERLGVVRSFVERPAVSLVVVAVVAEVALLVGYLGLRGSTVTDLRYLLYPFVWINLALWGVFAMDVPASASTRARRIGLGVAVLYFSVLAYAGGVVDTSLLGGHVHTSGFDVSLFTAAPPGWAPTVVVESATTTVTFVPYQVIGYLGLTYLTYVAVVDVAVSALSGAIGLLSCVSCSWPVFASLVSAVVGSQAVASAIYAHSLDLSTFAFVVAVAFLVWRPGGR